MQKLLLFTAFALPLAAQAPVDTSTVQTLTNDAGPVRVDPMAGIANMGAPVEVPIRNITNVRGLLPHMLTGIGIITGLPATGSSDRLTRQAILNFINANNMKASIAEINGGNIALVSLTATLPAFATENASIEVQAQSLSDATALRGGTLLRAELRGVDGLTYAIAQGQVIVSSISASGSNASVKTNPSVSGIVKNGIVIRPMESNYFSEAGALELQLRNPSVADALAITQRVQKELANDPYEIETVDSGLIRIQFPDKLRTSTNALDVLYRIGRMSVPVESPSTIVVDQTSGVVIAGAGVLISPCVVGLSDLTISVINDEDVVQPNPFANGDTARIGRTHIEVKGEHSELKPLAGGTTVGDLLQNLRSLGLTPAQLLTVFLELDRGHYLHAKLEVR
ncbi:flagellar P-ring protein 1 [Planctomycetota bacterium]|nr:flagellar P-ring protein 1 [Planctomycetota bacterium]